jgi:hypothetical protein
MRHHQEAATRISGDWVLPRARRPLLASLYRCWAALMVGWSPLSTQTDWYVGQTCSTPIQVCSAVGILPLSLQYGFEVMENFLL